jgi:hypothetical protein
MQEPGFLDRLTDEMPESFDPKSRLGKDIEVEFGKYNWHKNLKAENVHLGNIANISIDPEEKGKKPNALFLLLNRVADKVKDLLNIENNTDFIKEYLTSEFFKDLKKAVVDGNARILKVDHYTPPKQEDKTGIVGQTDLLVRTAPVSIPNSDIKVQLTVIFNDFRTRSAEKRNLSLKKTISVDIVENKEQEEEEVSKNAIDRWIELEKIIKEAESVKLKQINKTARLDNIVDSVYNAIMTLLQVGGDKFITHNPYELLYLSKGDVSIWLDALEEFGGQHELSLLYSAVKDLQGLTLEDMQVALDRLEEKGFIKDRYPSKIWGNLSHEFLEGHDQSYKDLEKKAQQSQQLPRKYNKLTSVQLAEALKEGYKQVFGEEPTLEIVGSAWAQVVLEAGMPVKLPNNNMGNIKAGPNWVKSGKPYFEMEAGEFTPEGKHYKEPAKWAAFATPAEGAAGYWNLIKSRYGKSIPWMKAGDPMSASVILGLRGWYTAPIDKYSKAVQNWYDEFGKKVAVQLPDVKSNPIQPTEEKPIMKRWSSEYSKEEKSKILEDKPRVEDLSTPANDVNGLIRQLLTANEGKLVNIVKNSINTLPDSNVLIKINNLNITNKIEFAKVASEILDRFIGSKTKILQENDNIDIECIASGSEGNVAKAAEGICNMLVAQMNGKLNTDISVVVLPGLLSKYAELDEDDIMRNNRQFDLNRIMNV